LRSGCDRTKFAPKPHAQKRSAIKGRYAMINLNRRHLLAGAAAAGAAE
jgi:hypothetical protein